METLASRLRGIKGVLFDKDGTLVDYYQTWTVLNNLAAKEVAKGDEELARVLLSAGGWCETEGTYSAGCTLVAGNCHDLAKLWHPLLPESLQDEWTVKSIEEAVDEVFYEGLPACTTPVCDLHSFVAALKSCGLAVGLATNDSESGAYRTLEPLGACDLFDFVCGYDTGFGPKPKPGMVHAFCEAVGIEAREVAMVGDSWHDMEMGRRAGVSLRIGVLTGTAYREDLEPDADVVLESIRDIQTALEDSGALKASTSADTGSNHLKDKPAQMSTVAVKA